MVLLQIGAKDLTVIICIKVMALFRIWLIYDRKALCALSKHSCFYVNVKYSGPYFFKKYIYQASNVTHVVEAINPGVGLAAQ